MAGRLRILASKRWVSAAWTPTTLIPRRFPMLTDEQLGERLRTRLNAEVADIVSPTGLSAVVRRRFSHQTRARRAAMLTPVAVAAAVIVAFAVPSGDSRSGGVPRADPSRPATAAPQH